MKKACEERGIPDEVYAKKGSHCDNTTMTKVFLCDLSRIMRHPAAITAADLGECYNRMSHPTTSIAMQSWGVPKSEVKVALTALQLMQFCLRTGSGESPEFLGGTYSNPFTGSGQGSGWAPSRFGALSLIVIGAYKRYGGEDKITSPCLVRVFFLAVVMYVDNTDLLHRAESPEDKDEELIESVQRDLKI